jgi:putative redox protein
MTTEVESASTEVFYAKPDPFPKVAATFLRNEQVLVHFAQTTLLVDHPVAVGGTDLGPTPGDLLQAALAACTAVYVGRHCARLGIPLESVYVGTSREIGAEAAPDGPLAGTGEGLIDGDIAFLPRMRKRVEVRGPLTPEHLKTIEYLVEHCAIGETLKRGVELQEEIVHITDRNSLPFNGRVPGRGISAMPAQIDDCCSGDACEIPKR